MLPAIIISISFFITNMEIKRAEKTWIFFITNLDYKGRGISSIIKTKLQASHLIMGECNDGNLLGTSTHTPVNDPALVES